MILFQARVCHVTSCRRPTAKIVRTRGGVKLLACKHVVLEEVWLRADLQNNAYAMRFAPSGIRLS